MISAKDIAARFGVPFKIADAIWDTGALGWKALRIIDKMQDMKNKIGTAINKKFNVLKNFDVDDWPKGIRLHNKSVDQFWRDLVEAFGPSSVDVRHRNRLFTASGVHITYYWAASGGKTIAINGNQFKFRF